MTLDSHNEDGTFLVRSPRFEPGSSAWQADVLDQTRLRPHRTILRYSREGKIVQLLLNLKSLGKTDLTGRFVSDRLKHITKHVDLDDANAVNLLITRKQCLESHKWLGQSLQSLCTVLWVQLS